MGVSLALVGCGAMGSALLKGWLTLPNSKVDFKEFWVVAPHRKKVEPFLDDPRVHWVSSPEQLPGTLDGIVFAVKPDDLEAIVTLYRSFAALFISVATGKPIEFYENLLSTPLSFIRALPNTPVQIHKGVIGLLANKVLAPKEIALAKTCFKGMGLCLWVDCDEDIDKITALSGSGPAYVFYMIEALAHSAESLGFSKETAVQLALYTFWGAASYAHHSTHSPEVLRENVTSAKGTTAAALNVLERGDLYTLMETAVKAAYNRAKELADERKSL